MRSQAGAATYRRGSKPAANGTRSATLAGPHCSRPDDSPLDSPLGPTTQRLTFATSSDGPVGLAAAPQPPQEHPQPPRHRDDGLLATAGVRHQLPVATRRRPVVAD